MSGRRGAGWAVQTIAVAALVAGTVAGGPAGAETTLRFAVMGEPGTLDPAGVSSTWEDFIVSDMFMGLTTEDPAAETIPGAAESWTVSDDGLVYTFKLRDHMWADGTKVTADDFVFALRRLLDPARAAEYASLLYTVKGAEAFNTGKTSDPASVGVRAIDPQTVEYTLEVPAPYFLDQLTHYTAFPVPRHLIEAKGDDWVKPGTIVGNGAYTVVEWTPNSQVVAVKNEKFWDAANVKIDKVVYLPDQDRIAVANRFRAGEIDMTDDFASEQIDLLRRELPNETRIYPYLGVYYYTLNVKRPPLDNPQVRRALSMAVDREAITDKVLKTGEVPAYSWVPPGTGGYDQMQTLDFKGMPPAERLEQAKALMSAAGYGPDKPLKLELSYNTSENHKRIAVAVAAMWKPLGVELSLVNRDATIHYDTLQAHDFDVGRAAWVADYADPQNFLYLMESRTGVMNYGQYSNPAFDRLMAESALERDHAKRFALMAQAERIAMDDNANIPIYHYVSKRLVSTKIKGYVDNTKSRNRTRWLSIEP